MRAKSVLTIVLVLIIPSLANANLVQNPSMEGVFIRQPSLGFACYVANYWTGWVKVARPGFLFFEPSNSYAHDGSRSQTIYSEHWECEDFGPDGIYQKISSLQVGQAYRFSVWVKWLFAPDTASDTNDIIGRCSLGVDPNGGSDPNIVRNWMFDYYFEEEGYEGSWTNVVTFFCPNNPSPTIFIQISGQAGAWFVYGWPDPVWVPTFWRIENYIDDVSIELIKIGQQSTVDATSPVPADGTSYSEVRITVLDTNSNPIEGIPPWEIIVNCTGSGNTIIGPEAPTNANGQTTAKIKSTVAETKTVSSTVLGTLLSDTGEVEFIPRWIVLTMKTSPNDVNTVTPTAGMHNYAPNAVVDISASRFVNCPDVYVFDHWEGDVSDVNSPQTTVIMDTDKTVTAVFVDGRQCGDECHPYPSADLDKNCKVDFLDFALFTAQWLECTDPNCD